MIEEFELEGSGSQEDPIIIKKEVKWPQKFAFIYSQLFIHIEDYCFNKVELYKCWNFSFENCEFKALYLLDSFSNKVSSCNIGKLKLVNSSGNRFKLSNISKISSVFSLNNHFEGSVLPKKSQRKSDFNLLDVSINYRTLLPLILVVASFFPIYWILKGFYFSQPLGFDFVLNVILLLTFIFLCILIRKLKWLMPKKNSKSKLKNKNNNGV